MNFFQALILSAIEGLTEFLPISSTGHLILASRLLNIQPTEFVKSFEIIIQFGAILAVVVLYFGRIMNNRKLWLPMILAFIPTGILGLTVYKLIKTYLLGSVDVVLWSLLIGGVVMIVLEKFVFTSKAETVSEENLSPVKSVLIGIAQAVSMIPGVSRSAASIFGGMGVGLNREAAVEFSFLLAIPTMAAASGLDLVKSGFDFTGAEIILLMVGFVGAFATATISVKWLIGFIQKHNFVWFGIYRIIIALIFLVILR